VIPSELTESLSLFRTYWSFAVRHQRAGEDGLIYVALVATLPEYRRRGYAEAVMRKALGEASRAHGVERTVLHASDMGFPVYRDMGYRTVRKFDLYGEAEVHG